ncbi:ITA10 protein, partial [Oriolus oriolus]|nr:ITA10 protein [Oriolus oriolus]
DLVLKATTDIVGSRYPGCPPSVLTVSLRSWEPPVTPLASRKSPHILRKGRRRMLVEVELENREENAYNASLWLHLPRNLHFSSLVLQVQNFGCYPIQNVTLHMALPALGHRQATILSVTRVLADNATCVLQPPPEGTQVVLVPPEDLLYTDRLDCSNTWCQELSCRLGRLERGGGVSVQLLRTLHDSFFSGVKFRSVRIVSSVWLGVAGDVLVLEEGAQRREV